VSSVIADRIEINRQSHDYHAFPGPCEWISVGESDVSIITVKRTVEVTKEPVAGPFVFEVDGLPARC
jgi:hypothetical protein